MQKINIYSTRGRDLNPTLLIKVLSWENEAKPEQKKKNDRNEGKNGITSTFRETSRASRPMQRRFTGRSPRLFYKLFVYNHNYIIRDIIMLLL